MYLEYIENKEKILPDLVNKEYVPPEGASQSQDFQGVREQTSISDNGRDEQRSDTPRKRDREDVNDDKDDYERLRERLDEDETKDDYDDSDRSQGDRRDREERRDRKGKSKSKDSVKSMTSSPESRGFDRRRERSVGSSPSSAGSVKSSRGTTHNSSRKSTPYSHSRSRSRGEDDDDLSRKIKKLLRDSGSKSRNRSERRSGDGRDNRANNAIPPSLSELKNKGEYNPRPVVRELIAPSRSEQDEEDAKRELIFKFELLKKSYKNAVVPEFTVHSDYTTMLRSYDSCVKRLTIENNVENYKQYLIGGFMIMEYGLSSYFKLDMSGFAQQQIMSMNSYEKLLIELGEKSYIPESKNWPVEARLLFMVVANAAFFVLTKMIMKKTGSHIMGMFNNMTQSAGSSQEKPKQKMRGPDIDLNEIPGG
jgi:hypothetical protein